MFDSISKDYNVLLVGTSSFGDGDAPTGYGKFLYQLYNADESSLRGIEHAVIGFGSSYYYTFQNIPRITDRLLGKAGSRRILQRLEIDEMDDEIDHNKNIRAVKEWSAALKIHFIFWLSPVANRVTALCWMASLQVYLQRSAPFLHCTYVFVMINLVVHLIDLKTLEDATRASLAQKAISYARNVLEGVVV